MVRCPENVALGISSRPKLDRQCWRVFWKWGPSSVCREWAALPSEYDCTKSSSQQLRCVFWLIQFNFFIFLDIFVGLLGDTDTVDVRHRADFRKMTAVRSQTVLGARFLPSTAALTLGRFERILHGLKSVSRVNDKLNTC